MKSDDLFYKLAKEESKGAPDGNDSDNPNMKSGKDEDFQLEISQVKLNKDPRKSKFMTIVGENLSEGDSNNQKSLIKKKTFGQDAKSD
jgi:hypothetical protein